MEITRCQSRVVSRVGNDGPDKTLHGLSGGIGCVRLNVVMVQPDVAVVVSDVSDISEN